MPLYLVLYICARNEPFVDLGATAAYLLSSCFSLFLFFLSLSSSFRVSLPVPSPSPLPPPTLPPRSSLISPLGRAPRRTSTPTWTRAYRSLFDDNGCLEPWFHGSMSRDEATRAIDEWEADHVNGQKQSGVFLFRYSDRPEQVSRTTVVEFYAALMTCICLL